MIISNLNNTNFKGLSSKYAYNNKVKLKEDLFLTEQNLFIPLNESFKELNDNKINNFSSLYLTKSSDLSSFISIQPLEKTDDEGFSTYFAVNAANTFTPNTRFWVTEEPLPSTNKATVSANGRFDTIDNAYFFDVELLDEKFCKISHEYDNVIRYLTVDYSGSISFAKDIKLDQLGKLSPQIFYYVYDRNYNYMVFIKNVNDICKFVTYNAELQDRLVLADPLTGTSIPYSISSIFKIRPRASSSNSTVLFDPWVSYEKDFKTNTQNINAERSFNNVPSNLLVNNEYFNIKNNTLDVNVLSLKNTNTPENNQSRNNPFANEKDVIFRDYKSLYTGTNQLLGDDNITLGYESFTSSIILKKDKITHFHIPQTFYPFEQLNVADAGLVEAGAIAGDHPIKSDKIFKKKADYKYTSYFGDTKEETTGQFLCSWLSGSPDVAKKPVWVDRYYNPKNVSFLKALTSSDFKAIKYISLFDCINVQANVNLGDVDVYDKPSDLIFEKGTYYAYHHYGPNDVNRFINSISDSLVQSKPASYKYYNGPDVLPSDILKEGLSEYIFDGTKYAISNSLSSVQNTNQFTLLFDMYSEDWTSPLGYQIIGNFDRDGFGIFNKNIITTTTFLATPSALNVTNKKFQLLNSFVLPNNISSIIRKQGLEDCFLILKDNSLRRYNLSFNETRKTSFDGLGNILGIDYNETYAFVYCINTLGARKILLCNLINNQIKDITTTGEYSFRFVSPFLDISNNNLKNVNFYDNKVYFTPGLKSERTYDKIYYLNDTKRILCWENISTNTIPVTAFYSNTVINDFSIDFDNNIWVLYNNNKFVKYTSDRKFILSGILDNTNHTNYKIEFEADFNNKKYNKNALIVAKNNSDSLKCKFYRLDALTGALISSNEERCDSTILNNFTNSNFIRSFIKEKYSETQLSFRALLTNSVNANDIASPEITLDLTDLDPGYHSFGIRFDADNGRIYLFVDGQLAGTGSNGEKGYDYFAPRKYKFSNFIYKPFLFGTSNYSFSIPLFSYLKDSSFLANNFKLKNIYIYNKALFDFDIMFHARKNMNIEDIVFDIACGRRNYNEEIERYFKFDVPGSKSTLFNLIIRNAGIVNEELKVEIEKRVLTIINSTAPAYAKLNKIIWSN